MNLYDDGQNGGHDLFFQRLLRNQLADQNDSADSSFSSSPSLLRLRDRKARRRKKRIPFNVINELRVKIAVAARTVKRGRSAVPEMRRERARRDESFLIEFLDWFHDKYMDE